MSSLSSVCDGKRDSVTNAEKRSGYKVGEPPAIKLETLVLPIKNTSRKKYESLYNEYLSPCSLVGRLKTLWRNLLRPYSR